jgi:hypothetical protein
VICTFLAPARCELQQLTEDFMDVTCESALNAEPQARRVDQIIDLRSGHNCSPVFYWDERIPGRIAEAGDDRNHL